MKAKHLLLLLLYMTFCLISCKNPTADEIIGYGSKYMIGNNIISTIYSKADGQTPAGKFQLYIWSSKNESVRFQQITTRQDTLVAAGMGSEGCLSTGDVKKLI